MIYKTVFIIKKNNNRKPNFQRQQNVENFNFESGFNRPRVGYGYVTPNPQGYPPFMPNFERQKDNNYGDYGHLQRKHNYGDYGDLS